MFKITHELVKLDNFSRIEELLEITSLTAARNQRVSFQVVLQPRHRCIVSVASDPALSDELSLPRYRVKVSSIYKTELFNVLTLKDENGIEYTDILTHQPFVKHDGHMPCAVWVDASIQNGKSSDIIIEIFKSSSTSDEVKVYSQTISCQVLAVDIPLAKDSNLHVDLWQHNSNIARMFEVPLWSDQHFVLIENVVATLANVSQKSVMIIASECPWNGWGTHIMSKDGSVFYEHSIIALKRNKQGELYADFTAMQRYIDLCSSYGIDGDISVYGLLGVWNLPLYPVRQAQDYPESVMVRYLDETDGCYKYLSTRFEIETYIRLLVNYFKQTNQFDRVRIAADEPKSDPESTARYDASIAILQSIDAGIKFKLAIDKDPVIDKYKDIISDFSTSFPCTCRYYDKLDQSKRRLWYVCNIPDKPNTFLKSPLLEGRLLGVLNHLFGYDGFLRWAYTCWTFDPRTDIRYATQGFPVGDLCLVYPEKNGDIALSLRYKALQRGIEDYEMIRRLQASGHPTVFKQVSQIIKLKTDPSQYMAQAKITHDHLYTHEINDFEAMRSYLLEELIKTA